MQRNELIGHQVVCSVFIEKDGKFLIVMCPGFKVWRVPGGRSEHGEPLEDTAVREMREETGLNFRNPRFIGWAQDQQYLIRDNKETSRLLMFFHVKTEEEPILDPREADDFRWVTLDELKEIKNKEGALTDLFHRYPNLSLHRDASEVVPRLVENEEAVLPSRMLIWEYTFLRTERRTAMRKKYQKFQTKSNEEVVLPDGVRMDDLIDGLREDIEAMGATHGLFIMHRVMEGQLTRIAGEKGKHMSDRNAIRGGTQPGYVIYSGQKVGVMHPRVRKVNGEEIPLPAYQRFQRDGRMQREVTKKVLAGVSSRNYSQVVEDVMNGYGIKKSSVDRHMVAATGKQLANLLNRPLGGLNICALMIDGKEVAGERLMVALGVDFRGEKHVLGLWQGTTENSEVCGALIDNLIDRGLDPNQGYLAVIDGAKGIKKAIETKLGDKTLIQRCQFHKRRNVLEHLPEAHQADVSKRIQSAYKMTDYTDAKSALTDTIRHLEGLNPSAARSLGS